MPRTRYTPEEVIHHLRTVELDAYRKLGLTEQTYRYDFLDGELFVTLLEAQV